jgi:predicted RNA-binding Zn-ribbon protein involved in translation (DUF1610 family)
LITIDIMTKELHKAFELLNKRFFENKLPIPAITIQSSSHNKLSMGWCTLHQVWGDKEGKTKMYEINISAEYIDLDFYETMDTLLHEMVHLYNLVHGIKDCSRNNTYHNKNFKDRAIQSGFTYSEDKPDKKYGWSFAKLSDQTKDIISKLDIDQSVFKISRKGSRYFEDINMGIDPGTDEGNSVAKKKSLKWVCPDCGVIVRSTKREINIKCGDCEEYFVTED